MIADAPSSPGVATVITAFEPGDGLTDAVGSALAQTGRVIVVDDGSRSAAAEQALERAQAQGAQVVRHGANRGIGAALGTGIDALRAGGGGATHLLTLDQDSALPDGYVAALLAAEAAARSDGIAVGMIAPGEVGSMRRRSTDASRARVYEIGGEPIQSGLLIPWGVVEELGGFREDLFIDGVDSDFYLRARARRLACVVAPAARIAHRLGREHRVRLAGRSVGLTVAADFRYYYQTRNLIRLVTEHGRTAPAWSAGAVGRELRHLALVSTLVPGRSRRLAEAGRGVLDGIRGRGGRRPDAAGDARRERSEDGPRPMVSVCMAAWNGAAYVREQVDSILDQLEAGDELVVVDDASTDETLAVLGRIADPRVRVLPQAVNRGYVAAFETALTAARGDVILLSDQDDVWLPGRVETMVADLADADVVATNLTTLDGPEVIGGPYGQTDWHLRQADSARRLRNVLGILAGNMPYYGCAMGIRREALHGGALPFPPFLHESHDLWLGLYGNLAARMRHDEARTVARRYHAANASPSRPRGVLPAIRSRLLLLRCIAEVRRRRSGR